MPDGSTAGPGRNKVCGSLCRVGAHGWRSRSRSDGCLSSSDRGLDTRQPRVSLRRNGRPHSDLQAVVSKRRHGSASFTATHQYPHLRLRRAMESIGSRFDSVGFDPRFSQERDQPRPIEDRHVRDLYRSVRVASSRRLPSIEPTHHGLAEVHRQSLPSPDKACMPQLPMRQIGRCGQRWARHEQTSRNSASSSWLSRTSSSASLSTDVSSLAICSAAARMALPAGAAAAM